MRPAKRTGGCGDARSWSSLPGHCQSKIETAVADRTAVDDLQAGFAQYGDDVGKVDTAVAVKMEVRPPPSPDRSTEIDGEDAPARLQDPADLAGALRTGLAGEVVQHDRRQDRVEMAVRDSA